MGETRTAIGKNLALRRDTISAILQLIIANPGTTATTLAAHSGFDPARVHSALSWLRAMSLVAPDRVEPTNEGMVIGVRDPRLRSRAALAFAYTALAGNADNVLWFETVNHCIYPGATANLPVSKEAVLGRPIIQGLTTSGRSGIQVVKEVSRIFITLIDEAGFGPLSILRSYDRNSAVVGQYLPAPNLAGAIIVRSLGGDTGTKRIQGLFNAGSIARLFLLTTVQMNNLLQQLQHAGVLSVELTAGLDRFYPRTSDWQGLLGKAISDEIGA